MRISDWSSDVCSSDLPKKPKLLQAKAFRKGRVSGWERGPFLVCEAWCGWRFSSGSCRSAHQPRSHRAKSRCPSGQVLRRWVSRLRSTRTERGMSATDKSEEPTSELTSIMRNSYAVFVLK